MKPAHKPTLPPHCPEEISSRLNLKLVAKHHHQDQKMTGLALSMVDEAHVLLQTWHARPVLYHNLQVPSRTTAILTATGGSRACLTRGVSAARSSGCCCCQAHVSQSQLRSAAIIMLCGVCRAVRHTGVEPHVAAVVLLSIRAAEQRGSCTALSLPAWRANVCVQPGAFDQIALIQGLHFILGYL